MGVVIQPAPRDQWKAGCLTWEVICNDSSQLGTEFRLQVHTLVEVDDSRPVNSKIEVLDTKFTLRERQTFSIPFEELKGLPYQGNKITISNEARLRGKGPGGKVDERCSLTEPIFQVDRELECAAKLIEPTDVFSFRKNFKAIPFRNRIITVIYCVAGIIWAAVCGVLGIHDQFASDEILMPRVNGEGQSPLLAGVAAGGAGAGLFWFLIRGQLRKYMRFETAPIRGGITPGLVVRAGELFQGTSRIDLKNIILRVVACNMEKGQYVRGSGTQRRTHSFSNPVNGMLLYEEKIDHIDRGDRVERWFPGEVYFDSIYDQLLPPMPVSGSHGLSVYWEIQLVHEDLVDQELVGEVGNLKMEDFLERERESHLL